MATQPNQSGAFIPTSFVFDISQIYSTDSDTPEFKEIIVRLYQYLNAIALNTNIKVSGQYPLQEFVNGKLWFPNPLLNSSTPTTPTQRQVFQTTINFGALPNAGVKKVAHNINPNIGFTWTEIRARATNPSNYGVLNAVVGIPIPYIVAGADPTYNIEIDITSTDVVITTARDYSAFTITYVIIEYLKF